MCPSSVAGQVCRIPLVYSTHKSFLKLFSDIYGKKAATNTHAKAWVNCVICLWCYWRCSAWNSICKWILCINRNTVNSAFPINYFATLRRTTIKYSSLLLSQHYLRPACAGRTGGPGRRGLLQVRQEPPGPALPRLRDAALPAEQYSGCVKDANFCGIMLYVLLWCI